MDIHQKIAIFMEDHKIFPAVFFVNYKDSQEGFKSKTQRFPMISLSSYLEDKQTLTQKAIEYMATLKPRLFPCRFMGLTVSNFKLIDQLKKEASMKIKNFFGKQSLEQY